MKKVLYLIIFTTVSVFGQISEIIQETWYLRYLDISTERYYVPIGENVNLIFSENNGTILAEANGVENVFSSEAAFTATQLTLSNPAVTLLGCSSPNCPFEDHYFYEVLTTPNLDDKTFNYYYNSFNQGQKEFWIRDNNFNIAYFTNQPIQLPSNLFQTWYFYESGVDLGDTIYYYGPNVPTLTILPDLSFTGTNFYATNTFTGNFIYGEDFVSDFVLRVVNLSSSNTGIPDLIEGWDLRSYVSQDYFSIESAAGFYSGFRNTITLGRDDFEASKVSLYPNPVLDKLHFKSAEPILQFSIYSLTGQELFSKENDLQELDVSFLGVGFYLITIKTTNGIVSKKLIKQ